MLFFPFVDNIKYSVYIFLIIRVKINAQTLFILLDSYGLCIYTIHVEIHQ